VFPGEDAKFSLGGWFSVGLHPWHVDSENQTGNMDWVKNAAQRPEVIAIGETGLDKTISVPFALQEQVFRAHLRLAEAIRKPLIIHCVRSYSEMLALRKKSDQSLPWIFHWFNSDEQMARDLIRKNCCLSFGHLLFRPGSKACQVFPNLPSDRIFMETDDAGFTIEEVYTRAAEIRSIDAQDWEIRISQNFANTFPLTDPC
jgi:TatD DNase family protein